MHSQSPVASDPLASLTRIVVSPAVEMLAELQALAQHGGEYPEEEEVRSILGESFIRELRSLYRYFHGGNDFVEFVMDQSLKVPPAELARSVREMSNRHFLWLILGRIYPEDALPEPESQEQIDAFVKEQTGRLLYQLVGSDFGWCDNATEIRKSISDLWQRYYDHVFAAKQLALLPQLEEARARKEQDLAALGGRALYQRVSGCDELPEKVPADHPYQEILYVPVTYGRGISGSFFGYGTILVPFDIRKDGHSTERSRKELTELAQTFKVLADPKRLRILQMIAANEYKFNGQRVADYMDLSTSVVSRHLAQLRGAGLIEEHSPDNRNIVYRVNREALDQVGPRLTEYIRDEI
jgi:DNA-binding transcriptional ArsR family regulator